MAACAWSNLLIGKPLVAEEPLKRYVLTICDVDLRNDRIRIYSCPALGKRSVAQRSPVLVSKHGHKFHHIGIHVGGQLIHRAFECGETHGVDGVGWRRVGEWRCVGGAPKNTVDAAGGGITCVACGKECAGIGGVSCSKTTGYCYSSILTRA
ncbi:hypothetical protein CRG98_042828 [Punica granatum]|uniref:Uncharacterized protein n=1 Tax=Punica granatum TaxID=22663 RepID=A0A2I0HYK5_PUNGR|nr:hypothetical protein CRG98_042828 [Punica granatum]